MIDPKEVPEVEENLFDDFGEEGHVFVPEVKVTAPVAYS